ncbi:MAG: hypothetical protein GY697_12865 [Desulfobacterales bacterium]|nr:hypothetical protein [Desulfobacterales bacterium]
MGDDEIEKIVGGVFGLPTLFLFLSYPHALKNLKAVAKPQLLFHYFFAVHQIL